MEQQRGCSRRGTVFAYMVVSSVSVDDVEVKPRTAYECGITARNNPMDHGISLLFGQRSPSIRHHATYLIGGISRLDDDVLPVSGGTDRLRHQGIGPVRFSFE
jgi:hypothetical protein